MVGAWKISVLVLFFGTAQADEFQSGFEGGVAVSEALVAGNYSTGIVLCQQNTQLLMMSREASTKGVALETVKGITPSDALFQKYLPDVYSGAIDVNAGGLAYINSCLTELIEKVSALTKAK